MSEFILGVLIFVCLAGLIMWCVEHFFGVQMDDWPMPDWEKDA